MGSVDEKKLRRAKFEEAYHVAKKDLVDHVASLGMPEDVQAWYSKVCMFRSLFGRERLTRPTGETEFGL